MTTFFAWFLFATMILMLIRCVYNPIKLIYKRDTITHYKWKLVGVWILYYLGYASAAYWLDYVRPGGSKTLISGVNLVIYLYASWALLIGGLLIVIYGLTLHSKKSAQRNNTRSAA